MVQEFDRRGKIYGGGFYEYPKDGKKYLWPGLREAFAPQGWHEIPFKDVQDRLLYAQALEAVRILEEGVISRVGDGNIGSILGIGFPPHTGGVFQFINSSGLKEFLARAAELEERYGSDFEAPQLLRDRAQTNTLFL